MWHMVRCLLLVPLFGAILVAGCGGKSSPTSPTTTTASSSSPTGAGATPGPTPTPSPSPAPSPTPDLIPWSFDGSRWASTGTPPACPSPLIQTIVNLSLPTAVLYPGQVRGGNYKPHGGFLFGRATTNDVTIVAPIGGRIWRGVRYIESGEIQYLFDVVNDCGVAFRLDHLLELSPKFASLAATLPAPTASSETTDLQSQRMTVSTGEPIATAVGFRSSRNVTVDFGVYDLRQPNPSATRSGEFAAYATCWLDLLPPADAATVRALPPGDGVQGRTSDFCR